MFNMLRHARGSGVTPNSTNQSNGSGNHGLAGQVPMGSANRSPALDGTSKRENTQPHAVVAAVSPRVRTYKSVTRTGQGKPTASSDHSSPDSVLASSTLLNSNDGEVGSQQVADGLNHINGNKVALHEVSELPASESKRSGSSNSTNNNKTRNKSNEAEEPQLSEATQSSSPSNSMRPSSCGSQELSGMTFFLLLKSYEQHNCFMYLVLCFHFLILL